MRQSRGSLFWFLFSYRGRISRIEFWVFVLAAIVACIAGLVALGTALEVMAPVTNSFGSTADFVVGGVLISFLLLCIVCGFAVSAKRFHDRRKSGWWSLIGLVPVLGPIWLFVECGCLRGTSGENRFGPDPLGGHSEALSEVFE